MTEMVLEAAERLPKGKGAARKLRQQQLVPGILYGRGDPLPVQMPMRQAERVVHALHGGERLITVRLANGDERQVILKEVQTTPTGGHLLHIDLHEIDVTKTVVVTVEVRPVGTAAGLKMGGTFQTVTREVDIECLPTIIPEYLDADVSAMEIGDTYHVADLSLPEGLKMITSPDETLFVVSMEVTKEPGEEEELEGLEAAVGPAAEGEKEPAAEERASD